MPQEVEVQYVGREQRGATGPGNRGWDEGPSHRVLGHTLHLGLRPRAATVHKAVKKEQICLPRLVL